MTELQRQEALKMLDSMIKNNRRTQWILYGTIVLNVVGLVYAICEAM